ncbi:hypothetical protein Tco_0232338 [Tanacetum coccineum]
MNNNIMEVGSRDRPPMLATGRMHNGRSRSYAYIDTRPREIPQQLLNKTKQQHTQVETVMNMTPENRAHSKSEKEAIHMILTGIRDEIYSTVDACQTAQEINNLTVATMQVNVQFLQQLQPEWSRFVTIVKQQHKLNEVLYHKLFDILKQYQKEVNELRAERIAKNANPLALVATAQNFRHYINHQSLTTSLLQYSKASLPTRSHATTRYKGKETSSNTRNKNVDTTLRYKNDNQTGQFGNQRTVNVAGARETVAGTDEEIDKQRLEAHYQFHGNDPGGSLMQTQALTLSHWNRNDQNVVECDDERVALANLIANLSLMSR